MIKSAVCLLILLSMTCATYAVMDGRPVAKATTSLSLPVESVTIYPDGLVFVKRAGAMEVTGGVHDYVVKVPEESLMETVLFTVSNATIEKVVYETLPVYTLNMQSEGVQDFLLSYLMRDAGMWSMQYSMHLENDSARLDGKAVVNSDLGEDLKDVRLKLVAGPEKRVDYIAYNQALGMMDMKRGIQAETVEAFAPQQRVPGSGELETLFIFEIENKTDLERKKTVGLPLFEEIVPLERIYVWQADINEDGPAREEIRPNNTGDLPWPEGEALVYRGGDYVATVVIPYTPPGSNASLAVGASPDLKVSRKLKDYNITEKLVSVRGTDGSNHSVKVTTENWSYLLDLRSSSANPIRVEVSDSRPKESEIVQIQPQPAEITASGMKWMLYMQPREEAKISYTYRIKRTEGIGRAG